MVILNSTLANYWLRKACALRRPCEPLLVDGSPAFRQLFKHLINHFDLEGLYAVYSLRRGGATWDFLLHQWREPC